MIFVLLSVSAIVFYLARGFPTAIAPWAPYISSRMTAEQIQQVIKEHGFDQPLHLQYFYWLQDILRGDWGNTGLWAQGRPAMDVFLTRFPYTVELSVAAVILTVAIGLPLGIISALKNNKLPDHISRIIALTGYSTPAYWFGYILQLVFFYYFYIWGLPYLPSSLAISGDYIVPKITGLPVLDGLLAGNLPFALDALVHLILPAFSLAFISL